MNKRWMLASALASLLLLPASADASQFKGPVRVVLKSGERVVLRDVELGTTGGGRSEGSRPPGMEPGERPGSLPPAAPSRLPREPGFEPDSGPAGRTDFGDFGQGLGRYRGKVRKILVTRVDRGDVWVDLELKDGQVVPNYRMSWRDVYGWERPGQRGEFHSFPAEDVRELELLDY